jgi:hypothetical protein
MQYRSEWLCQTWVYAQEESSNEVMVYYAKGYPLPPARGRAEMTFQPTSEWVKRVIAPTCGLDEIPGTWRWQPNGHVTVQTSQGIHEMELIILELTEQRLCIQAAPGLLYSDR